MQIRQNKQTIEFPLRRERTICSGWVRRRSLSFSFGPSVNQIYIDSSAISTIIIIIYCFECYFSCAVLVGCNPNFRRCDASMAQRVDESESKSPTRNVKQTKIAFHVKHNIEFNKDLWTIVMRNKSIWGSSYLRHTHTSHAQRYLFFNAFFFLRFNEICPFPITSRQLGKTKFSGERLLLRKNFANKKKREERVEDITTHYGWRWIISICPSYSFRHVKFEVC